jgi:hypothetical protein
MGVPAEHRESNRRCVYLVATEVWLTGLQNVSFHDDFELAKAAFRCLPLSNSPWIWKLPLDRVLDSGQLWNFAWWGSHRVRQDEMQALLDERHG